MLHVQCTGSPLEIGTQHGRAATLQVKGSITFYTNFFRRTARLSWSDVEDEAKKFLPFLEASSSAYVAEMRGIAEGAGVSFESILALNVRSEIGFGMAVDGCTAFAWKTDASSFIGQNWDWELAQSENIISLHIEQAGKPTIHMMSEAGIIGKIGLNSEGVGVTLNAIKAKGVDFNKLPIHLALRTVLDSNSQLAAQQALLTSGVAAACHITICDSVSGGVGLECTARDVVQLQMENGICAHSNHLIRPHSVPDLMLIEDSPFRLKRVKELLKDIGGGPNMDNLANVLKDEENFPAAICRSAPNNGSPGIATLFSIIMDVKSKFANVKMGRPTEAGEEFELRP